MTTNIDVDEISEEELINNILLTAEGKMFPVEIYYPNNPAGKRFQVKFFPTVKFTTEDLADIREDWG